MRTFRGKFDFDQIPLIVSRMEFLLQSLLYGKRKAYLILNKSNQFVKEIL